MDFNDTPEEAAFRAEAQAWLAKNATPKGARSDAADPLGGGAGEDYLSRAKAWQKKKADAGFVSMTWPVEWGGRAAPSIYPAVFAQEEAKYETPGNPFQIGLGMCIPTLLAYASEAQKKRYAGPAVRGEEIWCQLFSEPAGGSDVAGLKTRAVRDGDDWIINGQKVWTSGAHYSDFGIVLVRTNPDKPKHAGLTMFFLSMKSKGVDVRPIHQMSGGRDFNEVFFTDVRVPDSQRLGAVDEGWGVSLVTLMNERLAVGGGGGTDYSQIMNLAQTLPGGDGEGTLMADAAFRSRLADWYIRSEGLKHIRMRTQTALSRGQTPGPENSIGKIITANQMQDLADAAIEAEDHFGIINDPARAPLRAAFQAAFMSAPGLRIAGGTDEILKNIIAERVLGLPQDVRVDKGVAFKDLPTGR
jgi:alkylation response protein AidB-like acyl-CoA dehydrogenase